MSASYPYVIVCSGEGSWTGYIGSWGRYDAAGQQTREYSGVRLFCPIKDEGDDFRYDQINIYSAPVRHPDQCEWICLHSTQLTVCH